MNAINPWLYLVPIAGLLILIALWWFYGIGKEIQAERVRESFRLQRDRLEKLFFEKASSTGLPRGLRWISCAFNSDVVFAKDRKKRKVFVALVSVSVQFEAIEGSDMEGLPAVPQVRHGSALLHFLHGDWTTFGKVIFNLGPVEVLDQFADDYEKLRERP